MRFLMMVAVLFSGGAFAQEMVDQRRADAEAIHDARLSAELLGADHALAAASGTVAEPGAPSLAPSPSVTKIFRIQNLEPRRDCNDDGAGSQACWQACSKEGYSSGTCGPRCGVATNLGSQACWLACGKEGYSSVTCAPRCGTETSLGSQACWQQCVKEGYGSTTCAPRCGTR